MLSWRKLRTLLVPPLADYRRAPQARSKSLLYDRLSILMLSLEWVFFGSLHFFAPNSTIRELPDWVSFDKYLIVILTGILEVMTGTLVLVPTTRRLAALMSLCLLALFVPAMFHILTDDSALPPLPPPLPMAFRVALMPNNICLAILSIYLWRHPEAALDLADRDTRPRT